MTTFDIFEIPYWRVLAILLVLVGLLKARYIHFWLVRLNYVEIEN